MYERRLQVFVSSTYSDLREERQAAVEAILTVGHIPAGMELFAAGDQSQMEVIRQWIDDSDIFLLILGGRYGSIDLGSGKSYIQLEYEHAVAVGKPLFACVVEERALEDRIKLRGSEILELKHPDRLAHFRSQILTKVVRFWSDVKDIKLAIHESLGTLSRRGDLRGWIRGDRAVNTTPLVEELTRLTKENAEFRARLADASSSERFGGLSYYDMKDLLAQSIVKFEFGDDRFSRFRRVAHRDFKSRKVSLLHAFWDLRDELAEGIGSASELLEAVAKRLCIRGLVVLREHDYNYALTPEGSFFLNRLELEIATRPSEGSAVEGKQRGLTQRSTGRKPRKRGSTG
jgi:hypothetical protein